jgi:hypothetical protein
VERHHREAPRPQDDLVQLREGRRRGRHARAERPERAGRARGHPGNLGVHRQQAVQVRGPRHAPSPDRRASDRRREGPRVHVVGERRAVVRSRQHRQHERGVGHGPGHRSRHREGVPGQLPRIDGHQSGRGAESHDAAEGRGRAQRSAQIRAVGERAHPAREGHRRTAARAATGEGEVPGIPRHPEDRVEGVPTRSELRRVRLADDDGARGLQPGHGQRILGGNVALVDLRAPRGADPLGGREVLDGHRHAVERAERAAAPEPGRRLPRCGQRRLARQRDVRVHMRVDHVDPGQDGLHDLERRDPAGAIQADQLRRGCEAEITIRHEGALRHGLHARVQIVSGHPWRDRACVAGGSPRQ